jgi:hypothetical protein
MRVNYRSPAVKGRAEDSAKNSAGPAIATSRLNTNGQYQSSPVFALAGAILSRLPESVVSRLFPVGAIIDYRKPAY